MRYQTLLRLGAGLLGALVMGCSVANAQTLPDTKWLVETYNDGQNMATPLADTELSATFSADGALFGNAGCNIFRGTYTTDDVALSIGPLAMTRRACFGPIMDQEQAFLSALQSTSTVVVEADRLTLLDAGGGTLAVFVAAG